MPIRSCGRVKIFLPVRLRRRPRLHDSIDGTWREGQGRGDIGGELVAVNGVPRLAEEDTRLGGADFVSKNEIVAFCGGAERSLAGNACRIAAAKVAGDPCVFRIAQTDANGGIVFQLVVDDGAVVARLHKNSRRVVETLIIHHNGLRGVFEPDASSARDSIDFAARHRHFVVEECGPCSLQKNSARKRLADCDAVDIDPAHGGALDAQKVLASPFEGEAVDGDRRGTVCDSDKAPRSCRGIRHNARSKPRERHV